jgi:undecaprenyl pyrophosphate phosphatase UppP
MKSLVLTVVAFFAPVLVLAQATNFTPIETALNSVRNIINIAIPIAVALAVLFFFWGLATYILNASGDPGKREEGRTRMIWGVIALFIIVSIWGIVGFLGGLLGIGQGGSAPVPGVADEQGGAGENPTQIDPGS